MTDTQKAQTSAEKLFLLPLILRNGEEISENSGVKNSDPNIETTGVKYGSLKIAGLYFLKQINSFIILGSFASLRIQYENRLVPSGRCVCSYTNRFNLENLAKTCGTISILI
jgi:hypothetical protein